MPKDFNQVEDLVIAPNGGICLKYSGIGSVGIEALKALCEQGRTLESAPLGHASARDYLRGLGDDMGQLFERYNGPGLWAYLSGQG